MSEVRTEADELVEALLDECVAVGWVVVGDEDLARQVAARVVHQTREQWSQWRQDRPVARVREAAIARAVLAAPPDATRGGESGTSAFSEHDLVPVHQVLQAHELGPDSDPRDLLVAALAGISPRGRALLAATTLQDATSAEAYELAQVGGGSVEPLDAVVARVEATMRAARRYDTVEALVRAAAFEVSSQGVIEQAEALHRTRVRRRLLLGTGLALVTLGGVAAFVRRTGMQPARQGASSRSSRASPATTWGAGVDPTMLPPVDELDTLLDLPDLADTGIPMTWGVAQVSEAASLSALGTAPGSIRAVFMHVQGEQFVPVVHIPAHDPPYVALDGVLPADVESQTALWSTRLIDAGRRRVALISAGSVVVVEPGTGTVQRIDLPSKDIVDGGWSAADRWIMVETPAEWLRVDPDSGEVRPVGGTAGYGRKRIQVVTGTPTLYDIDGAGVVNGQRDLTGPVRAVHAGTVTNTEGWAATSAIVALPGAGQMEQVGAFAASWDVSARTALLVTDPSSFDLDLYPVIGWAPGDVALLPVSTASGTRLLGWNVITGDLWTVAREIRTPRDGPWGPLPSLSP